MSITTNYQTISKSSLQTEQRKAFSFDPTLPLSPNPWNTEDIRRLCEYNNIKLQARAEDFIQREVPDLPCLLEDLIPIEKFGEHDCQEITQKFLLGTDVEPEQDPNGLLYTAICSHFKMHIETRGFREALFKQILSKHIDLVVKNSFESLTNNAQFIKELAIYLEEARIAYQTQHVVVQVDQEAYVREGKAQILDKIYEVFLRCIWESPEAAQADKCNIDLAKALFACKSDEEQYEKLTIAMDKRFIFNIKFKILL